MAQPRFDVAISFLSADEPIAAALHNALSNELEVFFYPRSQEVLAGMDGLEAMRAPFFLEQFRVVVVLYREPWGETPWTGAEALAIKDRCLKDRFQSLFFLTLDKTSALPAWLPLM